MVLTWILSNSLLALPAGLLAEVSDTAEPTTEAVLRIGNESNQPDGVFGPLTCGPAFQVQ